MARYFARIVRALIVNTLGFGGGCGLLVFIFTLVLKQKTDPHALQSGLQASLQAGLQAGLVIGLLSSCFLVAVCVLIDLTTHLFLAKGLYKEIWDLEQTRDVVAAGTVKEVMQATRQALLTVPNIKNVSDDVEHLVTRARTGPSQMYEPIFHKKCGLRLWEELRECRSLAEECSRNSQIWCHSGLKCCPIEVTIWFASALRFHAVRSNEKVEKPSLQALRPICSKR
jgi:hypothetical protein